jgi:hypothetical protein
MTVRRVRADELHGGLRSTGSHPHHLAVHAFCQCGWTGPTHPWDAGAADLERAELAAHLADSGHTAFPDDADGYHSYGCGHFHELNDACPYRPDSPAGQLRRITTGSTLGHPDRALDRLTAIEALRAWLDDQEKEAAIGARLSRCTWNEMGAAIGATRQAAWNRWGQMINRYENAGVLPADTGEDLVTER